MKRQDLKPGVDYAADRRGTYDPDGSYVRVRVLSPDPLMARSFVGSAPQESVTGWDGQPVTVEDTHYFKPVRGGGQYVLTEIVDVPKHDYRKPGQQMVVGTRHLFCTWEAHLQAAEKAVEARKQRRAREAAVLAERAAVEQDLIDIGAKVGVRLQRVNHPRWGTEGITVVLTADDYRRLVGVMSQYVPGRVDPL